MKSMCHDVRRNSPSVTVAQADRLLHADGVADRVVLDRTELLRGDAPRGRLLPRAQQRRRAEQAADVVGAERWLGADCHGHSSSTAGRAQAIAVLPDAVPRREPERRFYIIAPRPWPASTSMRTSSPTPTSPDLTLPDGRPFPLPPAPRDALFETMERFGIDGAVVSTGPPGAFLGDAGRARELARAANEGLAALTRAEPERFAALALLPLPDVDDALTELSHALDTLGLDGVMLLSNVAGTYVGDAGVGRRVRRAPPPRRLRLPPPRLPAARAAAARPSRVALRVPLRHDPRDREPRLLGHARALPRHPAPGRASRRSGTVPRAPDRLPRGPRARRSRRTRRTGRSPTCAGSGTTPASRTMRPRWPRRSR